MSLRRPIKIESIFPCSISEYKCVRPMPKVRAASLTPSISGIFISTSRVAAASSKAPRDSQKMIWPAGGLYGGEGVTFAAINYRAGAEVARIVEFWNNSSRHDDRRPSFVLSETGGIQCLTGARLYRIRNRPPSSAKHRGCAQMFYFCSMLPYVT